MPEWAGQCEEGDTEINSVVWDRDRLTFQYSHRTTEAMCLYLHPHGHTCVCVHAHKCGHTCVSLCECTQACVNV